MTWLKLRHPGIVLGGVHGGKILLAGARDGEDMDSSLRMYVLGGSQQGGVSLHQKVFVLR